MLLRARDEASRVVNTFSRNLKAAGLAAQAAQRSAEAASIRQRAATIKSTSTTAQQIRTINEHVIGLDKQARALTLTSAQTKEYLNELLRSGPVHRNMVRFIQRNIQALDREAQVLRAEAQVRRNAAQQLKVDLDKEVRALLDEANALETEAKMLRQSAIAAKQSDLAHKELTHRISKVTEVAEVGAFAFGALGAAGLISLKGAIDAAVKYENQVRKTFTQVDKGRGTLQEVHDAGIRIASRIAVPFEDVQEALFDIFGSMEIGIQDAEKLLESFAKAAVAGQTDIQSASRATIGIMNAFNIPVKNINDILDIQFQLVKEGIGSYEEWNTRIGLVTPSAVRAGQSLETMAAALATATRFSIPAARSATAVSRALDAMSHPKAIEAMKAMGVRAVDAKGKFRPLADVFRDLKAKLDKLPEAKRLAALLEIFKGAGGTIEARRFLQNILLTDKGLKLFEDQLKNMKGATGSFEEAYDKMSETTAMQSILLNNKFQILKETIGTALMPIYNEFIGVLMKVLDWFNKLPKGTQDMIAKFILIGSIIAIAAAAFFAFIAVIGLVASAIASMGTLLIPVIAAFLLIPVLIAAIVAGFINLYQKSEAFRQLVAKVGEALRNLWQIGVEFVQGLKASFEEHLLPPLQKLWDVIETKVLPIFTAIAEKISTEFMPKIREAGRILQDIFGKAFQYVGEMIEKWLIPAIEDATEWYKAHQDQINGVIGWLGQLAKWLLVVIGFLGAAGVVGAVMVVITSFKLLVTALKFVWEATILWIGWLKTLWGWIVKAGNAVGDFLNWLSALPDKGAKAVKEAFNSIKNSLSNASSLLVQAGKNTIQGFINGVLNMGSTLKNAIINFIKQNVPEPVLHVLGISSPSKVFKKIGMNTIHGLINGIHGTRKPLSDAMHRISRDVTRALSDRKAGLENLMAMQPNTFMNSSNALVAAPPGFANPNIGTEATNNKQIVNNFYITTQEIDPRKNAADLGWELTSRM